MIDKDTLPPEYFLQHTRIPITSRLGTPASATNVTSQPIPHRGCGEAQSDSSAQKMQVNVLEVMARMGNMIALRGLDTLDYFFDFE
jgi:hypothetical protein